MLDGLVIGLVAALLSGGRLRRLEHLRIRGGPLLLGALLVQLLSPSLVPDLGGGRWIQLGLMWVLPAVLVAAIAGLNWRQPGMGLVSLGVVLNIVVVVLNAGMPVSVASIAGVPADQVARAIDRSWLHVVVDSKTAALLLADVIPIPGPSWHRSLVSLGDVIMSFGVGYAVFVGAHARVSAEAG